MSQSAKKRLSSSHTTGPDSKKPTGPVIPPRPSACIILLSSTNEILLVHRVQTSTSFPSAHVFPGGNLSSFHEPGLPPIDSPEYHQDSQAYRLAALRETFEEFGILLATSRSSSSSDSDSHNQNALIHPDLETASTARKAIHADKVKFSTWVEETLQARLCVDELVPFTRWITPPWNKGKRFTTQMYLGFMPLSAPSLVGGAAGVVGVHQTPTSDGGIEHTAATFAPAAEWLAQQRRGEIFLFPPQCFLLTMVARAFATVPADAGYEAQREALLQFVRRGTEVSGSSGRSRETAKIPWTDKVMSPEVLFRRESDNRLVLGVDKPGLELKGSGRGGDFERVVLVNFTKEGPRDVEVRDREDVMKEQKNGLKEKIMKL